MSTPKLPGGLPYTYGKGRCRHPDCIYSNSRKTIGHYFGNCNYMQITGRSRIADLPEELRDPALCPKYVPRPLKKKK